MTRLLGIWRSWTLLRQLVVGVSAVVMVVLVAVGVTSVLSLRGSVLSASSTRNSRVLPTASARP